MDCATTGAGMWASRVGIQSPCFNSLKLEECYKCIIIGVGVIRRLAFSEYSVLPIRKERKTNLEFKDPVSVHSLQLRKYGILAKPWNFSETYSFPFLAVSLFLALLEIIYNSTKSGSNNKKNYPNISARFILKITQWDG